MKKGFTLVEELGTIIIIAILALILIPVISGVINAVDKQAFRESVKGILDSANNYITSKKTIKYNGPIEYPIIFACDGTSCKNVMDESLSFGGNVPIGGKVVVESEVSLASFVTNGKWCASGSKIDLVVAKKCSLLDYTNPEINTDVDVSLSSTTNSIIVSIPSDFMYDEDTGISKYEVALYLGDTLIDTKEYVEPNVIFTNLLKNTEYKVVVTGTNGNNGKTSVERRISTADITNPTMAYVNVPEGERDYYNSQTLVITYIKGNVENPRYYIKSARNASTSENVIASCGNETNPGECSTVNVSTISAGVWYEVSGNINVIYNIDANEVSSLTALTYDGVNYSGATSRAVSKIENSTPIAPVIAGGSNDWTNDSRTISVSTAGSAFSGVAKYQYYVSTASDSQTGGSWQDVPGTSVAVSTEGVHYVFFRTVSNGGYNSGASNAQTVKVDVSSPAAPVIAGGSNDWTNDSRTISVSTASTSLSGIKKYQYYISTASDRQTGGSWQDVSGTSVAVSTEGTHYVFFKAISNVDIASGVSNAQTVKVEKTLAAPTITGGSNDWTNGSRTISVSEAGSATSGVAKYQYYISTASNKRSGGSWTDGDSVTVSTDGTRYVFFRTVSNAGYTSAVSGYQTTKVEKTLTAPAITGGSNDWTNSSRTISVSTAGSATSGVAKYQYYISTASGSRKGGSWTDGDSVTVSTDGTRYVFFRTVSNAGYTSAVSGYQTTKVEKTLTAPGITGGSNDWTNSSRTISVSTAGTATSGVAKYQYYVSTSSSSQKGGSWTDGNSVTVSTEGTRYVFFRTVSNGGYTSGASGYQTVKVDKSGPSTPTLALSNDTRSFTVSASGSTDSSVGGVTYKYYVSTSNSAPANSNSGFSTTTSYNKNCGTTYYAWAIAVDSLGNKSSVSSAQSATTDACKAKDSSNNKYYTIQEAINSNYSGTITVLADSTEDLSVLSNKNLTLSSGYKITGCLSNNGTLTIDGGGTIYNPAYKSCNTLTNTGKLTVKKQSIENLYARMGAVMNTHSSEFTMDGATVSSAGNTVVMSNTSYGTITSGNISTTSSYDTAVLVTDSANLWISGTRISNMVNGKNGLWNTGSGWIKSLNNDISNSTINGNIVFIANDKGSNMFTAGYCTNDGEITTVKFPTWSDRDGQDDIKWYEVSGRVNHHGGSCFVKEIYFNDHYNDTGRYYVHMYPYKGSTTYEAGIQGVDFPRQ